MEDRTQILKAGHRMCPGCGTPIALRAILEAAGGPVITANSTGCSEICFGAYPYTAFGEPWIHSLFENSPSVLSGLVALHENKKKRGELSPEEEKTKFLCIGGDGAMSDIGFQWLSGAVERNTNAVFVCFDNEGFMNTGNQRSSSTPKFSSTSTTPTGKEQNRKPLAEIIAAHNIPYVAQACPSHIFDLKTKAKKAFETEGASFLNILTSCPTNWKSPVEDSLDILVRAVETTFWSLFEVENGVWKINFKPKDRKPVEEWLKGQKRFAQVLKDPKKIKIMQDEVDRNFEKLLKMEEAFG